MEQLCRNIRMPKAVTRAVLRWHRDPDFCPDLSKITDEATWAEGYQELKTALGDDPDGFRMLTCMLRCALSARDKFHRLGLSEEIYYDTMGCFSRFVNEHMESYGRYGFDRGWWTVRQVSCKLLRIGQLEYELITRDSAPAISLHIPTDVRLHAPLLRESYLRARQVISRSFPAYQDAPMVCNSWLLSPTLTELLPPHSHILAFQRAFRITALDKPCTGVIQWVFKNPQLPPEQYPENTSLQRKLKAFLLNGGTFLDATGTMIAAPFLSQQNAEEIFD